MLPSASGVGYTATLNSAVPYINGPQKALNVGTQYQVIWAFLGLDSVNGGYTISQSSSAAPAVTITTNNPTILLNIPAANLPAGAVNTPAIAVFLKAGNGNYSLTEFAYLNVNSGLDFNFLVKIQPVQGAPAGFTSSLLTSGGSDPTLGSRLPYGWTFSALTPTTGGVKVTRQVSQVTFAPDTAADFNVTTTRTASIEFKLLPNDILDIIKANAGVYASYVAGGHTYSEGEMSLNTAAALITGNSPLLMVMPPDALGVQETRLYLGQLLQNQEQNEEDWTKTAPTPITYKYNAVSVDKLTIGMSTELNVKIN